MGGGHKGAGVSFLGLQIFLTGLLTTCLFPTIKHYSLEGCVCCSRKLHCSVFAQGPHAYLGSLSLGAHHRSEETHGALHSSPSHHTRPEPCPSEPMAVRNRGVWTGRGSSQSSGYPRILLSTSCARQRGVTRSPFLTPSPHPHILFLPGGMWSEQCSGLASQAASFFFCRSICLNIFCLTGKNAHSRAGASLGQAGVQSIAVRACAHCQGVSASLLVLGAAGLGVSCINGTWPRRSRDIALGVSSPNPGFKQGWGLRV